MMSEYLECYNILSGHVLPGLDDTGDVLTEYIEQLYRVRNAPRV